MRRFCALPVAVNESARKLLVQRVAAESGHPRKNRQRRGNAVDGEHGFPDIHRARTVDELTQQNVHTVARIQQVMQNQRRIGDRVADSFKSMLGSWTFLLIQSALLAIWVVLNVVAWCRHWDPYPFILLNLMLSFQAAYAAPIIMMSQNREEKLAERRNRLDLQINMLAEQETTEILRLLRKLCEHQGIKMGDKTAIELLSQKTSPEDVARQIDEDDRPSKKKK